LHASNIIKKALCSKRSRRAGTRVRAASHADALAVGTHALRWLENQREIFLQNG
jgi:hypothetical protein